MEEAPEIDAAWQKLELFPTAIAESIDMLRRRMLIVSIALDQRVYPVFPAPDANTPRRFTHLANELSTSAAEVLEKLEALILDASNKVKALD